MADWVYEGRWALVTGASAGIGAVMAEKLAERGMNVVLTARRLDRLETLSARLHARHAIQTAVVTEDLSLEGAPERLWSAANEGRRIDLLVNNAGFGTRGRFNEVPLARHLDILHVNGTVLLELTHRALQDMRARGRGAIINVSSIAAFQPVPHLATYAASKAFVLSLSQAIWVENRDVGIRVVALCPGRTPTEFQAIAGTGSAEGAFGFRTPEQVVEAGLLALERDRGVEVSGIENRAATWAMRALPGSAVLGVMKTVVQRLWKEDRPT